ncbi:hypothetical protein JHK82_056914 [Glycine max]|nr:hypothetical protein JHK82_056914 [Glycine max]
MSMRPTLSLASSRVVVGACCKKKWSWMSHVCKKFIFIVDEFKLVNYLGGSRLAMPVEVIQFCWRFTVVRLHKLFEEAGCVAKLRTFRKKENPYVTNNGNFIVGLYFKRSIGDLKVASYAIVQLTVQLTG